MAEFNAEFTDIAIIGMAGRFPEADSIQELWENLKAGRGAVRTFEEWEIAESGVSDIMRRNVSYIARGGVLQGVENFDADFFEFTASDAKLTDPQQRLFLECAWEALENSGYPPAPDPQAIGVYGSMSASTYLLRHISQSREFGQEVLSYPVMIGNDKDFLCTRVSYKLNLSGPSVSVQTACSSSLAAVHIACQSLINGECEMALAGGVSITVPQHTGYAYKEGGTLSRDGWCRAFDKEASGTVKGNGCGIVLLKPLEQAIKDRDTVYAVIKSTSLNNDGRLKIGFTAPSLEGQSKAVRDAIEMAGISAEDIQYVEAHGTGTSLGDPIEIKALTDAFATTKKQYCAVGSIKPSLGHLDAAAGVANLIKAAMVVKEDVIPGSLHFRTANPKIDFVNSPFYMNRELQIRGKGDSIQYAGVNSLGMGGTNAFAVLQKGPQLLTEPMSGPYLFVFSGKTMQAMQQITGRLNRHLTSHPEQNLSDIAFTLAAGRKSFDTRTYVVCRSKEELLTATADQALLKKRSGSQFEIGDIPPVAFRLNTSAHRDCYRQLYDAWPAYRTKFDQLQQLIEESGACTLRPWLEPGESNSSMDVVSPSDNELALHFLGIHTLAVLLAELGMEPEMMYYEDLLTEWVAYSVAGACYPDEAWKVVAAGSAGTLEATPMTNEPKIKIVAASRECDSYDEQSLDETSSVITIPFGDAQAETIMTGLLIAIGNAWVSGREIDWDLLYQDCPVGRVPLPTYPFEKRRYWIELEHNREEDLPQVDKVAAEDTQTVEQILTDIWKKRLDIEEFYPHEDFFLDLNGDSLLSIEIVSDIRSRLNIDLSLHEFSQYSTINRLADQVSKLLQIPPTNPVQQPLNQTIVKIKEGTVPGSLFLVHPAGGTIMVYRQLAAHLRYHPTLYGINFPAELLAKTDLTVDQLAERYVAEIRQIQPKGPYMLGGYSFGGNVALEIALQFQRVGERVTELILFDSFVAAAYEEQHMDPKQFLRAFPLMVNALFRPETKLESYVLSQIQELPLEAMIPALQQLNIIPVGFAANDMKQLFNIWELNIRMLQTYKPEEHFLGNALIFDALEKQSVMDELMVYLGELTVSKEEWRGEIAGEVGIVPIQANHYSLFQSTAHLRAIAHELEQRCFFVPV
ncbi:type I polyketide synthase [Paenibacillus sp. 1001270B_150601_E10]|uniref:type I polyketide synthase n=1 Tax=Paenibacillus sp. 1001270B_150601_E10 TaxID=2787079 RepID=UPI00189E7516|nr:beta-ketoacyl synthase N-terminal-like domain-containing protein [Paenibacillus sp. 1001270B_150601_E10]